MGVLSGSLGGEFAAFDGRSTSVEATSWSHGSLPVAVVLVEERGVLRPYVDKVPVLTLVGLALKLGYRKLHDTVALRNTVNELHPLHDLAEDCVLVVEV